MAPGWYTAEEVAGILGLHVRTVRGYVRQGRLPAVRIGKQYRIAAQDLEEFIGGCPGAVPASASARTEVSAIVTIDGIGRSAMDRVATHVVGAASSASAARRGLHVQVVYDESRENLKVILVGDADDTAKAITLISALTEETEPQ
ncbi:helix-turn-helix domain-containing protein [Mycobacterium sp. NAZ190054]|uniref:helix-turn-helix domain-containing protein n=1 Tax=Mycobacterium sp. NAZ190054 TaxID=1747766 RepID=UPI0007939F2C|nr:helix-turn-helix domain-containing protein [Mycobacterium sp. NAZ190054]KWX67484.1 hypothetical protein ASJ79_00500 [Mycobacterium sp. NAZ190054]